MSKEYVGTKAREYHILTDRPIFYALSAVSKLFEDKIAHVLYGGIGVQAHIANKLAKGGSLEDVKDLEKYFRQTSDLDFIVSSETRKIIPQILQGLPKEEIFDGELYFTQIDRTGETRNKVIVTRASNSHQDEKAEIYVTFFPESENCINSEMLSNRKKIQLRYGPVKSEICIAPVEHIIASKTTRMNPDKDVPDMINLCKFFDVDTTKVYNLLAKKQKEEPDYDVRRIMPIIRKGKDAFEGYLKAYLHKHQAG